MNRGASPLDSCFFFGVNVKIFRLLFVLDSPITQSISYVLIYACFETGNSGGNCLPKFFKVYLPDESGDDLVINTLLFTLLLVLFSGFFLYVVYL